jgi:putative ABC transport system substrate-binding protein
MRRREFIGLVGGLVAAWPLAVQAQKAPIRIGFMASGSATSANSAAQVDAIKQGLRDNGLIADRDYLLETRFAGGDYQRFPEMARELAQAGVRIILVATIASVRAAQNLAPPVPVVMIAINDPVGNGLVATLARPGGVTTGMATLNQDITPKMLELQRELVPACKTIAALFNPTNPSNPVYVEKLRAIAGGSGITVLPVELRSPAALDEAFAVIATRRPDALLTVADSGTLDQMDRIAASALAQKLPSFASIPEYALFGGLIGYGPSQRQLNIRATFFAKRILDGVNPGDLPVEQPTRIDLVINLKTARALGIDVSPVLLARADEVIE